MNKEWAELNKTLQCQLKKEETFADGVQTVLRLRQELFNVLSQLKSELTRDEFNDSPFLNAGGYHSKTIAYSIWHIFRIEDIVAHTLISNVEELFMSGNFAYRINSPIITTGNELDNKQVVEFSRVLDLDELYQYAVVVMRSTNEILSNIRFSDLKRKMTDTEKARLQQLNVVSADEKAHWLIDYWCEKDIRGLIQMPFTRHWIMHIEASLRIRNKILHKD